jgi:hypothetical protein
MAPLPEDDGRKPGDQQAWTSEQRHALTRHVDERARDAVEAYTTLPEDTDSLDKQRARYAALKATRDRALVFVLAYTAVRVGELLQDSNDPRRRGVRWEDLSLDEIVAGHLDYLHHEAFFVVSTTFEVTAYRTLWFGLQYDSETVEQGETVGNGALATVRWDDGEPVGDGHLQGQFAPLKDVVGDMIDKGVFTPSTARQYLKRKLAERVGGRQELLIPTSE